MNRFHEERKTKLSLILDNERWKQADVPTEFQDLVRHIESTGHMGVLPDRKADSGQCAGCVFPHSAVLSCTTFVGHFPLIVITSGAFYLFGDKFLQFAGQSMMYDVNLILSVRLCIQGKLVNVRASVISERKPREFLTVGSEKYAVVG